MPGAGAEPGPVRSLRGERLGGGRGAAPAFFLEDQRDAWGPARVLHAALELAGVATTGGIPPFVTAISDKQRAELEPTARTLLARERERAGAPAAAQGARR